MKSAVGLGMADASSETESACELKVKQARPKISRTFVLVLVLVHLWSLIFGKRIVNNMICCPLAIKGFHCSVFLNFAGCLSFGNRHGKRKCYDTLFPAFKFLVQRERLLAYLNFHVISH